MTSSVVAARSTFTFPVTFTSSVEARRSRSLVAAVISTPPAEALMVIASAAASEAAIPTEPPTELKVRSCEAPVTVKLEAVTPSREIPADEESIAIAPTTSTSIPPPTPVTSMSKASEVVPVVTISSPPVPA